jgi:hypothetical protein
LPAGLSIKGRPDCWCGEAIPAPQIPAELLPKVQRGKRGGRAMAAASQEFLRNYKCPRCGKNAFAIGPKPPESQ